MKEKLIPIVHKLARYIINFEIDFPHQAMEELKDLDDVSDIHKEMILANPVGALSALTNKSISSLYLNINSVLFELNKKRFTKIT